MNINEIVNSFRHFLNASWSGLPDWITNIHSKDYELDDWFQSNWELLVETRINEPYRKMEADSERIILEVYGNGADCNGSSSRVFLPEEKATHCILVNGKYTFDSFGKTYENGWFEGSYPFDFIKAIDKNDNEIILNADNASFTLKKITSTEP